MGHLRTGHVHHGRDGRYLRCHPHGQPWTAKPLLRSGSEPRARAHRGHTGASVQQLNNTQPPGHKPGKEETHGRTPRGDSSEQSCTLESIKKQLSYRRLFFIFCNFPKLLITRTHFQSFHSTSFCTACSKSARISTIPVS